MHNIINFINNSLNGGLPSVVYFLIMSVYPFLLCVLTFDLKERINKKKETNKFISFLLMYYFITPLLLIILHNLYITVYLITIINTLVFILSFIIYHPKIFKNIKNTIKVKKLLNTKYYIKSINKDNLLSNKNTYVIVEEYKGHKKIIDKFNDQTKANYVLNTYINEQKSFINKYYDNLNNKVNGYINKCDHNTINLLINIK